MRAGRMIDMSDMPDEEEVRIVLVQLCWDMLSVCSMTSQGAMKDSKYISHGQAVQAHCQKPWLLNYQPHSACSW